eukprot:12035935-Karenia_brevis.AAC.1
MENLGVGVEHPDDDDDEDDDDDDDHCQHTSTSNYEESAWKDFRTGLRSGGENEILRGVVQQRGDTSF